MNSQANTSKSSGQNTPKSSNDKEVKVYLLRKQFEKNPIDLVNLIKRMIKYFFRIFSYLIILNLKKSIKNIAKFSAIFFYIYLR